MTTRIMAATILLVSFGLQAQKAEQENKVPTGADLLAITARGKLMAEYDVAAWHATDVVQDLKPEKGSIRYYIAKKTEKGWVVVFGRLNEAHDKFLTVDQASEGTKPEFFTAKKFDPPQESADFFLYAARAFDTALKDLGPVSRPYNNYAIPSENGQLYVYLLPAPTDDRPHPIGGDVRYTFTADGAMMLMKRQMHKTVLDMTYDNKTVAGYHVHVLTLSPEDSDVFFVLSRKPTFPEYVGTQDNKIYVIHPDGTIGLGKLDK